jgi:hypothetical protein
MTEADKTDNKEKTKIVTTIFGEIWLLPTSFI